MEKVILSELNLNDKFKIFEDGCVWTVIEVDPKCYLHSIRASSGRITAPFNKDIFCYKLN